MMHWKIKTPRRKRRTCWDRLRARMIAARRRRQDNPAASAMAHLTALLVMILGRMPLLVPAPAPYAAPPLSSGQAYRNEVARRLGIPSRYVDVVLAQGTVPYALLFEHIRRNGKSRDDTMTVLRQQAPEACRDWLDHVEQWGLWTSLLLCHVRMGTDEDTDVKLMKSTLAWLQDLNSDGGAPGPTDAETALKPDAGSDDPNKPKSPGS